MAERGRRPKAAEDRRGIQISFRTTQSLRDQIEKARLSGDRERSLSEEIESRLRDSFEIEAKIEARFHGYRNYWLAQIIADGIAEDIEPMMGAKWWEDASTFDEAAAFINALLRDLRPKEDGSDQRSQDGVTGRRPKKGSFGEQVALFALAKREGAAKNVGIGSAPITRKIAASALPIVAQLVKSGRSPLARLFGDGSENGPAKNQRVRKRRSKQ